ncbi:hypothetical protein [Pseudobutyrivibrio sp.]|uniref:hypothetical protein n=1 Tax=Pseudobutyrivibrio sp. TaxID=2014367 RepID=UPI00386B99A0
MNFDNIEWAKELEDKINNEGRKSKYDILIPVSGGKDGTFMLWFFSKYTNLKILAFHIDNWYVAEGAKENVRNVCKEIGCDLVVIRPQWKEIRDIYKNLMLLNGEICMACEMMISLYPTEYAVAYNIPYIVWGLTPKQITGKKINSGLLDSDYKYFNNIVKFYEQMFESVYKDEGRRCEDAKESLLYNHAITEDTKFPTFVMPFYWLGYDAGEVEKIVTENINWKRPTDVGGTSSNCVINKLHIYLKKEIKGDEFYEKMMADKENANEVIRSVKSKALNEEVDHDYNMQILKELDIDLSEKDLITHIKNSKKDLILKMGSNISQ